MFEFLFKYPPEVFSKGSFVLLGAWPRWILVVLVIAAAALLAWPLWKKRKSLVPSLRGARAVVLWALETGLAALLLLLLWQPAISVAALKPQQNIVAVVVDDSRSMAIKDAGSSMNTGRLEDAKRILNDGLLRNLSARFQVRLYRMSSDVSRVNGLHQLSAAGPATRIGPGLNQLAAESATLPIGAVVLLTDGADNSGGVDRDTVAALRARRLPVSAIGFGKDRLDRDVELESLNAPSKALANSRLEAQVSLRQSGFGGARATLTMLAGGSVVASREIVMKGSGQQIENLEFNAGAGGVKNLEVKLNPLPGEENLDNNRLTRVLSVDDSKRHILYVEGEPRWEYKFLRRAVEDDPALQVASILRTTQNKLYRQGIASPTDLAQGFPNKPEELFAYQGLILGSVETAFFTTTQQEMIKQFVDRRGGGVLFLGGPSSLSDGGYANPPFGDLLPVTLPQRKNTFSRDLVEAELTDAGRQSLICRIDEDATKSAEHWKILPYLANYQDAGTAKPGAVVLANVNTAGKKLPLLVTENYGRGRSAVFATGGTWRWKMQQPKEDTSQPVFWRQLLRWLVTPTPSHVVASTPLPVLSDTGNVRLRAEVRNADYLPAPDVQVTARIVGPDGSSETKVLRPEPLEEGTYSVDWNAAKPGSYVAEISAKRAGSKAAEEDLGSDVVTFRREDGVAENFHHQQNRELLQRLAEETGGHYYQPQDAGRLADSIAYSEAGITGRETKDLWDMPVVFFAAIMLRASEWLLRRKWGAV
jgi:uncharacterized membrane protein